MRYFSTRDTKREKAYALKDAAFMGLAPDGGLFMPEYIPQVDLDKVAALSVSSYREMATYLASLFFGDDIPADRLEAIVSKAYDFECPLVNLASGVNVLELFHGPTYAFKDFGARFMGGMLGYLSEGSDKLTVLTATSGDTGSAVAAGFHNVPGVDVVVLYPQGKVSPLQQAQMTTLGGNIRPLCVRGCFDDCQALVKAVFNDVDFRRDHYVTSANSINILRWIPQSFYYFHAWASWKAMGNDGAPDIVVPSGNYGNITAGMLAAAMGMPVRRFIAGANANDVIPEFLHTGVYRPRPSVQTVANAMDVGAPSNYERMMCLYDGDFQRLVSNMEGYSYSDDQIKKAIAEIYSRHGYLSDPHAAVGYLAYMDSKADGFYLATAHAAKFGEIIAAAFDENSGLVGGISSDKVLVLPEGLAAAMQKEKVYTVIDNNLEQLETFVAENC